MSWNSSDRRLLLRQNAEAYLDVALDTAVREYPHFPLFIASTAESYRTHRQLHPAFFGSFDWHSCVEMHWVAIRLLQEFPDLPNAQRARAQLHELLTPENIGAEIAFFSDPVHKSLERPYGWTWLTRLAADLEHWDDPDGRQWSITVAPLAELLMDKLVAWLPLLRFPQRAGNHPNTAFSLSNALVYARRHPDREWTAIIIETVHRLFAGDTDYPAHYEPSGADFLSPALCEAQLMAQVFAPGEFLPWFAAFLPHLTEGQPESLFTPAEILDPTDGQLAHLHGLNLSRAWALVRLAEELPEHDARRALMLEAARQHAQQSLPAVTGSDYMIEHWLAAYAVLLLCA